MSSLKKLPKNPRIYSAHRGLSCFQTISLEPGKPADHREAPTSCHHHFFCYGVIAENSVPVLCFHSRWTQKPQWYFIFREDKWQYLSLQSFVCLRLEVPQKGFLHSAAQDALCAWLALRPLRASNSQPNPASHMDLLVGELGQVVIQTHASLKLGSLLRASAVLSRLSYVSPSEFYHIALLQGKRLGDYASFFPRWQFSPHTNLLTFI